MPVFRCVLCLVLLAVSIVWSPLDVRAQGIGGGGGGGGFGGGGFGGGGGGFGGNNRGGAGGITIDPAGVVLPAFDKEESSKLALKRLEAVASKFLSQDVRQQSPLRKVSLVRLEKLCHELLEQRKPITEEMLYLAGLQRIDYVFVFPETHDLVIAGPAEGFAPNEIGRIVGTSSGRPPVRLDDLVVALRSVNEKSLLGCSIDPVPENLARFSQYIQANSFPTTPDVIQRRFREMTQVLGMQTVTIVGVSAQSHFAQALLEADYRMKLISVGLERPKLKGFKSHLDLSGSNANTMQRWWFAPLYEPFQQSEDGNTVRFSGQRVQLMSQDEQSDANGNRSATAFSPVSTLKFAKQFTERYNELAAVSPVFAELQNLFDVAVFAALIQRDRLNERVQWEMKTFLDPAEMELAPGHVPRQVSSVFNTKRSGSVITGLVGGGVGVNPLGVLQQSPSLSNRELPGTHEKAVPREDVTRWWWD